MSDVDTKMTNITAYMKEWEQRMMAYEQALGKANHDHDLEHPVALHPIMGRDHESRPMLGGHEAKDSSHHELPGTTEIPEKLSEQIKVKLPSGETVWASKLGVKDDAYGAAMIGCCRNTAHFADKLQHGTSLWSALSHLDRTVFTLLASIVTVLLTVNFCLSIQHFMVNPAVQTVQSYYQDFHATVFSDNGELQLDRWEAYEHKGDICEIALTMKTFMCMVIALHVLPIVQDFRETNRFFRFLMKVEGCTSLSDMIINEGGDPALGGKTTIIAVTQPIRMVLSGILLFKTGIGAWILILGARLLASSAQFADLILNALALQFVLSIDDLIFAVCIPAHGRRAITKAIFIVKEPRETLDAKRSKEKSGSRLTWFYIFFIVAFVLGYVNIFQNVLPPDLTQIEKICVDYLAAKSRPKCSTMAVAMQESNQDVCYPYGSGSLGLG